MRAAASAARPALSSALSALPRLVSPKCALDTALQNGSNVRPRGMSSLPRKESRLLLPGGRAAARMSTAHLQMLRAQPPPPPPGSGEAPHSQRAPASQPPGVSPGPQCRISRTPVSTPVPAPLTPPGRRAQPTLPAVVCRRVAEPHGPPPPEGTTAASASTRRVLRLVRGSRLHLF